MFLPNTNTRAGVTIVESLVAITLLATGILGAAGTIGASWRIARTGDAAALAARRLLSVADSLAAAGARSCALLASGAETEAAVRVQWSVAGDSGARDVELTARYRTPGGERVDSVRTVVPCR